MSAPALLVAAAVGALGGMMLGSKQEQQQTPEAKPVEPPPQTQSGKAPQTQGLAKANTGNAAVPGGFGADSTMLTGPGGVADSMLQLAKPKAQPGVNTFLGG